MILLYVIVGSVFLLNACSKGDIIQGTIASGTENISRETQEIETQSKTTGETKNEETENISSNISDNELTQMQKVLLNLTEYINEDGHKRKVDSVENYPITEDTSSNFYVVDMDGDGINEVAVTYSPGYVMIFHEENGNIYGYRHTTRQFNPIYSDGTFGGSGSAFENVFYGNVKFSENKWEYSAILSFLTDEGQTKYYKGEPYGSNSQEITKEEYDQIMGDYKLEEAVGYDYTWKNIETFSLLTGCSTISDTSDSVGFNSETVGHTETTNESDKALSLMQQVLLDKAQFTDVESGKKQKISNVDQYEHHNDEYSYFYYLDLDGDGNNEVMVHFPYGQISIFHEINGEIYRYEIVARGMAPLYDDGTMRGTSGATLTHLHKISEFADKGYEYEFFYTIESDEEGVTHYYTGIDDSGNYLGEISKEEYENLVESYSTTETKKYGFSIENIKKIISN